MICDKRLKDLSTSAEELCQQLRTMIPALSCSKNSLGAESVRKSLGKSLGKVLEKSWKVLESLGKVLENSKNRKVP